MTAVMRTARTMASRRALSSLELELLVTLDPPVPTPVPDYLGTFNNFLSEAE
jgi:hypothetical protein